MSLAIRRSSPRAPTAAHAGSFVRYLKARRRKSAGGGSSYEIVLGLLWFGPGVALGVWLALTGEPPATPPISLPAAAALLLAGAVATGLIWHGLGPISAPPEWRAWVLSTPLDRGTLLRRKLFTALAAATVPGLILGAVLAEGAGLRRYSALAAIVVGILCTTIAGGIAVVGQSRTGSGAAIAVRAASGVLVLLIVAAAMLMIVSTPAMPIGVLWAIAGLLAVCCGTSSALARRSLRLIPITALARGSGASASLALAVYEQSLEPLAPLLSRTRFHRRASTPSKPLTGVGLSALASVDRLLLRRNRQALVRWLVLALVPYAGMVLLSGIGWGPSALAVLTYLAAVGAISGLCGMVRKFTAEPSLAERYGLDRFMSRRTAMVIPSIGAAVWAAITAPAVLSVEPPVLSVVIPAAALILVLIRANLSPYQPSYTMGENYDSDLAPKSIRGPIPLLATCFLLAIFVASSA